MTDNSFPAPLTPPPRVATPPLNHEELTAAMPHFATYKAAHNHNVGVPNSHNFTDTRQVCTDSNITPLVEDAFNTRSRRVFEVGQSSRRHDAGESRRTAGNTNHQQHQDCAQRMGGILKSRRTAGNTNHQQHQDCAQRMGGILKTPKKR